MARTAKGPSPSWRRSQRTCGTSSTWWPRATPCAAPPCARCVAFAAPVPPTPRGLTAIVASPACGAGGASDDDRLHGRQQGHPLLDHCGATRAPAPTAPRSWRREWPCSSFAPAGWSDRDRGPCRWRTLSSTPRAARCASRDGTRRKTNTSRFVHVAAAAGPRRAAHGGCPRRRWAPTTPSTWSSTAPSASASPAGTPSTWRGCAWRATWRSGCAAPHCGHPWGGGGLTAGAGPQADLAAVVMDEGIAHVCLVTNHMTVLRAKIEQSIPRKRRGSSTQHDKALRRFYDATAQVRSRPAALRRAAAVDWAAPRSRPAGALAERGAGEGEGGAAGEPGVCARGVFQPPLRRGHAGGEPGASGAHCTRAPFDGAPRSFSSTTSPSLCRCTRPPATSTR